MRRKNPPQKLAAVSAVTPRSVVAGVVVAASLALVPALALAVETDKLTVEDQTSGAVMFRVTSAGNVALQDQTAGSTATKFSINDSTGAQKFIATADGRLGVGTGSLSSQFDLTAQWPSSTPTNLMFAGTSYGDVVRFTLKRANGTSSAPINTKYNDVLGTVNFRGHDGANFSAAGVAALQAIAAGDFSSTSQPTNLSFFTTPTGSVTQAMRLQILANGNIGVGTNSPSQKLEVNGTVKATSFVGDGSLLTNIPAGPQGPTGPQGPVGPQGPAGSPDTQADILTKLAAPATGTTLVMQEQSAGSNATKLAIMDSTGAQKFIATADGRLGVGTGTLSSQFDLTAQWPNSTPTNLMFAGTSYGDVVRFTLKRANGTASAPVNTKYNDVLGTVNFRGHDGSNFSAAGVAALQAIAAGDFSSTSQPTNLSFFTTPTGSVTQAMRLQILANGNVGIGTNNPNGKLEVNGGMRLNTTAAQPVCDSNIRGTFWVSQNGSGVSDSLQVCIKDATDAYVWKAVW